MVLEESWTATQGGQKDVDKEKIKLETSLEARRTKPKLPDFGHNMKKQDSPEKTIVLGKKEGSRGRG